jgi:acyl-CoA synthetase (NDP forming)
LGLEIPELHEKTRAKLREVLPFTASVRNPVDVAGGTDADPSLFADCAKIILKDHYVGGLIVVGLFGGYGKRFSKNLSLMEEDAAHRMGKMVKDMKKPIILHSLYASERPHALELLRYYNIPVYDSLDVSCKCMAVLAEYGGYLRRYQAKTKFFLNWGEKAKPEGKEIIQKAVKEGRKVLLEGEAKRLLHLHGAPECRDVLARSEDEAVAAYRALGGEIVLKITSPDILHKTDAGGVRLHVDSEESVRRAFREIMHDVKQFDPGADIRGILVAPMAEEGLEVIIGTKTDDQFGPIIMYGLGGIMVEILKDVSFRVLPISPRSAKKMIKETKSYPILAGVRGRPPGDEKALRRLLLTVSDLIEAYPEIKEMDLNPIIIYENGLYVADARIILNGYVSKDHD